MGEGTTYNVNITGGNNQNAFGDHSSFRMVNNSGQEVDLDHFFRGLRDSLPDEVREQITKASIEPLRKVAAGQEPKTEDERSSLKAKIFEYAAMLEPYIPYIRRTLAAFASGALRTLPPPASWVVGGVLEVVEDHRK